MNNADANSFTTHEPEQTFALARDVIAPQLAPGTVVAITGPVGAGKTVLAKGIAAAFGVLEPVTSATFTIIMEYEGRVPVIHVDLYRLNGTDDAIEAGIEPCLSRTDAIVLVEWAERAADLITEWNPLAIDISITPQGAREITIARSTQ